MNSKKWIIRISISSIAIFLIMLYAYSTSFWRYIYGTNTIRNLTLYIAMAIMLFKGFQRQKSFKIKKWQAIFLIMSLFVLLNNQDILNLDIYYVQGFITLLIFILCSYNSYEWIDNGQKIIRIAAIIFAIFTIWFSFDTNFYTNNVLGLFDDSAQRQLLYSLERGASAGITKNYSINGTYLVIGIIASISWFFSCRKKIIPSIILGMECVALLLTGKRAHIIFLACALLVGFFFYNENRKKGRVFKILVAAAVACLLFLILGQFIPSIYLFYYRFIETAGSGDVTLGRAQFYVLALEYFLRNPIFGLGWGGFKYINSVYKGFSEGSLANTHNVYFQLLCEVGLVGTIFFVLFFAWGLANGIKLLKLARKQNNIVMTRDMLFSTMMQIFFVLYCITGNPLYDLEVLTFYLFSIAIMIYYKERIKQNESY